MSIRSKTQALAKRIKRKLSLRSSRGRLSRTLRRHGAICEPLESRMLLSTVTVTAAWDRVDGDVSSIDALVANPGLDQEITLREAIQAANNTEGEDEINFWRYLRNLSIEVKSQFNVTDTLTVNGLGQDKLALSGDGLDAFFNIDMSHTPDGSFTLTDITLQGTAKYSVYANPGKVTLDDVTIRLEADPELENHYSGNPYISISTITITDTVETFGVNDAQPISRNISDAAIYADQITIGKLTGIDMNLSIEASGDVQIGSVINYNNDLLIEGNSITATGTIDTSAQEDSDWNAGDITLIAHHGAITVTDVTANAYGVYPVQTFIIDGEVVVGYVFNIDLNNDITAVPHTDIDPDLPGTTPSGGNGGDITFLTPDIPNAEAVVYIHGDGSISANGGHSQYGDGGLSGTITLEQKLQPTSETGTLTLSAQAGHNAARVYAGGVWQGVDADDPNLRELVEQYGGMILADEVLMPSRIVLQLQQENPYSGGLSGLIMIGGSNYWFYEPANDHQVNARPMFDDQGRLVFTFDPQELQGAYKTYQILSQPDEGTIVQINGQFVFYPMQAFEVPSNPISFDYRMIGGGEVSNRATITMIFGELAEMDSYNTTAPVGVPNFVRTDSQTAIDINVLANDHSPDTDLLITSSVDPTSELGVALTVNADGTIAYDPTEALVDLEVGQRVRDVFTYTVADPFGNSDTVRVFVDVTGAQTPEVNVASQPSSQQLMAMAMFQPRRVNESTSSFSQMSRISRTTSTASTLAQHLGLINMDWSRYGVTGWTPLTLYHSDSAYELTRWFVNQFDDETFMATFQSGGTYFAFPTIETDSTHTVGYFRNLLTGRTPSQSGRGTSVTSTETMSGDITLDAGTLTTLSTGTLNISNTGTLNISSGGTLTLTDTINMTCHTSITISGDITGDLTITGSPIVQPTDQPGTGLIAWSAASRAKIGSTARPGSLSGSIGPNIFDGSTGETLRSYPGDSTLVNSSLRTSLTWPNQFDDSDSEYDLWVTNPANDGGSAGIGEFPTNDEEANGWPNGSFSDWIVGGGISFSGATDFENLYTLRIVAEDI